MKLEVINIQKSFQDKKVLHNVSFTMESGRIFGFLGPNGAGKTTTIRILMDVFKADQGSIVLGGESFNPHSVKIGYLPEERGMYSKTKVKDQLVYFSRLRGASKKEATQTVHHWCERFFIEEYLDKPLDTLSKGNQQKVQITQAFLNNPDILILDEPFSGLDPLNSKVFQDALLEFAAQGKMVIFSSHQMGYVEAFCDDICIIDKGEIVIEGALSSIKEGFGENKLRISANDISLASLQETLQQADIHGQMDPQSLIITLPPEMDKNAFILFLLEKQIDIHSLSDYEPTMEDIFIHLLSTETTQGGDG